MVPGYHTTLLLVSMIWFCHKKKTWHIVSQQCSENVQIMMFTWSPLPTYRSMFCFSKWREEKSRILYYSVRFLINQCFGQHAIFTQAKSSEWVSMYTCWVFCSYENNRPRGLNRSLSPQEISDAVRSNVSSGAGHHTTDAGGGGLSPLDLLLSLSSPSCLPDMSPLSLSLLLSLSFAGAIFCWLVL